MDVVDDGINWEMLLPTILKGRARTAVTQRLRRVFWAAYCKEMFRQMHASYLRRALYDDDPDLGGWNVLAKSTIKKKQALANRGVISSKNVYRINIRTERLIKSYTPGETVGDAYVKGHPEQNAVVSNGEITVGTNVPYAKHVTRLRPLFKEIPARWVALAVQKGCEAITPLILENRRSG